MTGFSIISIALVAVCVSLVTCAPAAWSTGHDPNTTLSDTSKDGIASLDFDHREIDQEREKNENATDLIFKEIRSDDDTDANFSQPLNQDSENAQTDSIETLPSNQTMEVISEGHLVNNDNGTDVLEQAQLTHSQHKDPNYSNGEITENGYKTSPKHGKEIISELRRPVEGGPSHPTHSDQPANANGVGSERKDNQANSSDAEKEDSSDEEDDTADEAEMIEEDYGVTDQRPHTDMPMSDAGADQLSIMSEGSPDSDAMTLSDDVIIDALFTNLDVLQDNIEMCEEGLRQKLSLFSTTGPLQTYTSEQVSQIISGSVHDPVNIEGKKETVHDDNGRDKLKNNGDEHTGLNKGVLKTDGRNDDVEDDKDDGNDDGNVVDDENDEEEDSDDDEEDNAGPLTDGIGSDSERRQDGHEPTNVKNKDSIQGGGVKTPVQNSATEQDLTDNDSKKDSPTPDIQRGQASTQAEVKSRRRRSTGDNHENSIPHNELSNSLPLTPTTTGKLSHNQASHDVVMRLSNRLHYLKESLRQCYALYKQMSNTRFPEEL